MPSHDISSQPLPADLNWPAPLSRYVTQSIPWWLSQAWVALTLPDHDGSHSGWTDSRIRDWLQDADDYYYPSLQEDLHHNHPDQTLEERPSVLLMQMWNTLRSAAGKGGQAQTMGQSRVDQQCMRAELLTQSALTPSVPGESKPWLPSALTASTARRVMLPVLLVHGEGVGEQGMVYGLHLTLWHRPGASLALVPAPAQQCMPMTRRFAQSLGTVEHWLRQTLAAQEGRWRDWALVWDLVPEQGGCHQLAGPSASAAFALGCLWLLRDWAPAQWRAELFRLELRDLERAYVTAEMLGREASGPLAPVGGGRAKDGALAVIRQVLGEAFGVTVPLRVAKGQSKKDPTRPAGGTLLPELHAVEYPDLWHLTQALAQAARPLNLPQQTLYHALRPALAALTQQAPVADGEADAAEPEAGDAADPEAAPLTSADWPYPGHRLPHLPISEELAVVVEALADVSHESSLELSQLVHYALHRWAVRARRVTQAVANRFDGDGQMHRRFVRLKVTEADRNAASQANQQTAAALVPYPSLESLMLDQEGSDPALARAKTQAYLLIGDPGAGKSWLMGRHEQALCEQLIWSDTQPERAALRPMRPVLPVYLPLKDLNPGEDPVAFFRRHVRQRYPAQAFGLLERAELGTGARSPFRLRLMLDGLNELRLVEGESAEARARGVVHGLQAALAPELPLLIGTRTHHAFVDLTDAGFRVLKVQILPWGMEQIRAYLRQRWGAGSPRIEPFMAGLKARPGLLTLMGLPLYLSTQCELLEAGATTLVANRAHLLSAMLWLRLNAEQKRPGSLLAKVGMLHADEQRSARQFVDQLKNASDQAPPPFPRRGWLLRGLFAQARAQWLFESDGEGGKSALADGRSRGSVSVPWANVRATLGALGMDEDQAEVWLQAVQDLGLAERSDEDQFSFSHQVFGEWAASQQLFYSHAQGLGRLEQPQPRHWSAEDLRALRAEMQPPPLAMSAEASLARQREAAAQAWKALPQAVMETWLEKGTTVTWADVMREEPAEKWGNERWLQAVEGAGILTRDEGLATWHWRAWGNFMREGAVFHSFAVQDNWSEQPQAWQQMLTSGVVWPIFRRKAQAEMAGGWQAQGLGEATERARALWQQNGRLGGAPLALLALDDPWPWLGWLMGLAPEVPEVQGKGESESAQPVWALAARCLADEGELMLAQPGGATQMEHGPGPLRLLAHTRQWLLQRQQDPGADLRHRLQAGEALGSLGPLGERGDSLRYERAGLGARLRWDPRHWVEVGGPGRRYRLGDELRGDADERPYRWWARDAPAWLAAYPVTVGEYQAFVAAGGYDDPNQAWWNPTDPARPGRLASAGADWLREREKALGGQPVRPYNWDAVGWRHRLHPVTGVTWYEAVAFCHWAAQHVYADRLAALSEQWGRSVVLRLPTECEWEAAVRGPTQAGDNGAPLAWPGHPLEADASETPSPVLFNHLATGLGRPSPVGSFDPAPQASGLRDAAGNSRDWCANRYQSQWVSPVNDEIAVPSLSMHQELRALRGCGYGSSAARCRVGDRSGNAPGVTGNDGGFRLVLSVVL